MTAWDFHYLFRRHAGGIRRSLTRRGFDTDVAADLTQDAFVRAMSNACGDSVSGHFAQAYLYRIARNLGINHAKRRAFLQTIPLDTAEAQMVPGTQPDTETMIINRESLRLVIEILAELPDRHRQAFLLHRIEGWSIARIADYIGLSSTRTWELVREAYRQIVLRTGGL